MTTSTGDLVPSAPDFDFEKLLACDRLHSSLHEAADRLELYKPDGQEYEFKGVPAGRMKHTNFQGTYTLRGDTITDGYFRFSEFNPDADPRQLRFKRDRKLNPGLWRVGDSTLDNPSMLRVIKNNIGIDRFDSDTWLAGVDTNATLEDPEFCRLISTLGNNHATTHEATRIYKTYPNTPSQRLKKRRDTTLAVTEGTQHQGRIVVVRFTVPFELAGGKVPLSVTVGAMPDGTLEWLIKATTPAGKNMEYRDIADFPALTDIILERTEELIAQKHEDVLSQD